MLDFGHIPTATGATDVQFFIGTSQVQGNDWQTWVKPRGKSMIDILLIGKGGNGGTGVIGAAGGGGAGGGSGGQTRLTMPLALVPDVLFLSLLGQGTSASLASYICVVPPISGVTIVATNVLAVAWGGGSGGNATTTTAGAFAVAALAGTAATMPLGWAFATALAGHAGSNGGNGLTVGTAGAALGLPTSGILVTGGTGAGGCPTTVGSGQPGGALNPSGFSPTVLGGVGAMQ